MLKKKKKYKSIFGFFQIGECCKSVMKTPFIGKMNVQETSLENISRQLRLKQTTTVSKI